VGLSSKTPALLLAVALAVALAALAFASRPASGAGIGHCTLSKPSLSKSGTTISGDAQAGCAPLVGQATLRGCLESRSGAGLPWKVADCDADRTSGVLLASGLRARPQIVCGGGSARQWRVRATLDVGSQTKLSSVRSFAC
jgi:hypothetical protein